ncbi:MAG TPA: PASTA domain-containing protein, partial [Candidatus Eisenbacteria bacterium]|nr:PASTA domain-containing protein [Candidatus Eisenbacteria bacterium]
MIGRFQKWRAQLLWALLALFVGTLVYRLFVVQVVKHDYYLDKAEKQWVRRVPWLATRGSIYDRNGSLLAATQKKYTVGVTPEHFPRLEKTERFLAEALDLSERSVRRSLASKSSYVQLARNVSLEEDEVAGLASLPGIKLDQVHDRINPLGALPLELVGTVSLKNKGTCGAEAQFQDLLRGEDGWVLVNMDARAQSFRLVNAPGRRPIDGCDLYLTIDSRVQEIVDFELERAVERYDAIRGAVIVVDPFTGDILALSEKVSEKRRAPKDPADDLSLFSVSCMYEPGSTFKLITDSYLLERDAVDPFDVYFAENGVWDSGFGVFRDDHEYGWLTVKQAFVKSSNICTIKAAKDSDPHDFYRYILRFGFGSKTGVALPAESEGSLRQPSQWSARSLASIAIGYEVGVTPLQMVMAYAALANGGELVAPRIALEARDRDNRTVREFPVLKVRRVFSRETADMMQDFCREVVHSGTGVKAVVNGLEVAGKTGTSEKFEDGSYQRNEHITSFIGFAPADDPEIVCLVLLDEPKYPHFWGGESAAPLFSSIVGAVNISTDLLCSREPSRVTVPVGGKSRVQVPSFLRLGPDQALQLASEAGLGISCSGGEGTVYAQKPDPGTLIEKGRDVSLLLRRDPPQGGEKVRVPALEGLSIREARRLLLACGLKSSVRG